MIELYCPVCGFRKSLFETEITGYESCELCNQILMKVSEDFSVPQEQIRLDNDHVAHDKEDIDKTSEEIDRIDNEIFKIMSNLYVYEIKEYGIQRLWNTINIMKLEDRLWHIELYLEALYQTIRGAR